MRREIRFLLGNAPRVVSGVHPTTTVLDWLRRSERRCGAKEGCAEGDCGACTVVLASPDAGGARLAYHAVNACIQFLPVLDGCQLITVEDIGTPKALHPVQQALCAAHASQCGYCTPGIAMSLFAAAKARARPSRAGWKAALAGNLCRCTGYGPILAAAESLDAADAAPQRDGDAFDAAEAATLAALAALDDGEALDVGGGEARWLAPRSLDEAVAMLAGHPGARPVAGLTDVGLWVTKQHRSLGTLVWLGRVPELCAITVTASHLEIGAAVTLQRAAPTLIETFPALAPLLARFASRQIRNVATVGGNIANGSPIGDLAPALIALGATLVLRSAAGVRVLAVEDFFIAYGEQDLRPGEIIEAVRIPASAPDDRFACYKVSKRFEQDISAVMAAFRLTLEGGRVAAARFAFGGMGPTPARAAAAERATEGRAFDEATVTAAMTALDGDFTPLGDQRASAAYRRAVARNLLRKFWLQTVGDESVSSLDAETVP